MVVVHYKYVCTLRKKQNLSELKKLIVEDLQIFKIDVKRKLLFYLALFWS